MNDLVKSALGKLIQNEEFRKELIGLVEDVNRSATNSDLVSRAGAVPDSAPAAAEPAPVDAPSPFADVKDAILKDAEFLKALTEALMALNAPAETARASKQSVLDLSLTAIKGELEKVRNSLTELSATMTEHDAVLIEMAEDRVVAESNQPRTAATFRARLADATAAPVNAKKPDLADRASKVLTRMGAK